MTVPYSDLVSLHNPSSGLKPTVAWGDAINNNMAFFAEPPGWIGYRSSAQSIPNATPTDIAFTSDELDTDTMHSTTTSITEVVIPFTGRYDVGSHVSFAINGTGRRGLVVMVNNGFHGRLDERTAETSGAIFTNLSGNYFPYLFAGAIVTFRVNQDSGSALDLAEAYAWVKWDRLT